MNYDVCERVLRTSVRAAGFDFTAQSVDRGERIAFAIWPRTPAGDHRSLDARPLYVPDPLPRLRDFESAQAVKECADRGVRAARRASERDAVA